jgi:hypothetical protein
LLFLKIDLTILKKGIIVPQISYAAFDQLAEESSPINQKILLQQHISALESKAKEKNHCLGQNAVFSYKK